MSDNVPAFLARHPGLEEDILAFARGCTPMVHRNEVLHYLNQRYNIGLVRNGKGCGMGFAYLGGHMWKTTITRVINLHKEEFEFYAEGCRDVHWRRKG